MKIETYYKSYITFGELKAGDVFCYEYDDQYYMKINNELKLDNECLRGLNANKLNAVNITNGALNGFDEEASVNIVNGYFVLEK